MEKPISSRKTSTSALLTTPKPLTIPWKKSYDQPKAVYYKAETKPTKVHLVKTMVFPGAMYGCESWTMKKPEC